MMKLFSAAWCSNCQPIKAMVKELGYPVDVIDVDEQPEFVRASGVRSIPSLLTGTGDIVTGTNNIKKVIEEAYGSATNSN